MYRVHQHWDPLRVCVVGRSYPPEFYQWIKVARVRDLFERIASETQEDLDNLANLLQRFGVQVLRPDLDLDRVLDHNGRYLAPPMTPRDNMIMIGDRFYAIDIGFDWQQFYSKVRDPNWLTYSSLEQFLQQAPEWQIQEVRQHHGLDTYCTHVSEKYRSVREHVAAQGNEVKSSPQSWINGAMVSRIGRDLYFATHDYNDCPQQMLEVVNAEFPFTRNHVINTGGHADGTYCPVCPGLIVSLHDVPTYAATFPGWEVVYLPHQSWDAVKPFMELKTKNRGRWWIPGFEHDQSVIDTVESWLAHWTGYVEETVFDVNMLIIDPRNVVVNNYNQQVFEAFDRYGITAHVIPLRHRYFWDGGIHCVTLDLDREGDLRDYFPT